MWKLLKNLHILQYQMFSHDLIINVNLSKQSHLINFQIELISNKWRNYVHMKELF